MISVISKVFVATIGLGLLSDAFGADPFGGALQYGALGLCGLMIWQNNADRRSLVKTLKDQQDKLEKLHVETLETIRKCKNNS